MLTYLEEREGHHLGALYGDPARRQLEDALDRRLQPPRRTVVTHALQEAVRPGAAPVHVQVVDHAHHHLVVRGGGGGQAGVVGQERGLGHVLAAAWVRLRQAADDG